jgi:hypothetical protein
MGEAIPSVTSSANSAVQPTVPETIEKICSRVPSADSDLLRQLHELSIRAYESPMLSVMYLFERELHFSSTGVGNEIQIRNSKLIA